MTLYLLKYNNYYNRIVKRISSIDAVNDYVLAVFEGITNFNPNDGISTKQIINYAGELPDYCVVCDPSGAINSQWFIIESVRTRSQQFEMTLYRDVISEWYDDVVNAPMFVEKATARIGDTAIFNNENMTYNQIKTSETPLKDFSNCPWIVGYLARDKSFDSPITFSLDPTVAAEYTTFDDYPYYKYNAENPLYMADRITNKAFIFNYTYTNIGSGVTNTVIAINTQGNIIKPQVASEIDVDINGMYRIYGESRRGYTLPDVVKYRREVTDKTAELTANISWSGYTYTQANFTNISTTSSHTLMAERNRIIKVGDVYYKVDVIFGDPVYQKAEIPATSGLGLKMKSVSDQLPYLSNPIQPVYEMEHMIQPCYFTFTETNVDGYTITIPSSANRVHCNDAPYDVFAIPYGEIYLRKSPLRVTSAEVGLKLARQIQLEAGADLYDLQLLPFCPLDDAEFQSYQDTNILLDVATLPSGSYTECYTTGDTVEHKSVMLWIKNSNFTKFSQLQIPVAEDAIEFKVQNECDMYRLCSPNWSGAFEFSATKNNGVNGFRIDCAYKPTMPYIRIAPIFNGLYGSITNDARGLICGGDFSLSQISDAWIDYQRQNANFQQIFDRQIENLEVNNSIQRTMETWNAATGIFSGAATGAMTGAMAGGGWGAAIGGIAGGAASLAGGLADIALNEQLRSEALDYTRDQFGYQLGNIKALPQSLTKVNSFNPNNKIFPILEYYTCTDIEKEALRNKIKYNGMTVMRVGTINEFIQPDTSYIKGKLIRLETLADDFHVVNQIADELYKGVFI